jgi:hypothetical protein
VVGRLAPEVPPPGAAVPFTDEQIEALVAVRAACDAGDSGMALDGVRAMLAPMG